LLYGKVFLAITYVSFYTYNNFLLIIRNIELRDRSMQHYIQFTNLTLISPHGIPFDNKPSRTEICLLPFKGKFCLEYRCCMTASAWINIVYGTMIEINR